MEKKKKKYLQTLLPILLLVVFSIAIRIPYTRDIEGVVGGDAFNYLAKSQALVQGDDPFAADPRKGPIFSLLLTPGLFTSDPLLWSRWVGVLAAAATVAMLPFLARRLGISWPLAVGSGLLLAVNPEFIWESPNALANTLFTAGIVASVLAYLKSLSSPRWLMVLSVIVALTTLTRYEGILVAAVLLPVAWWQYRRQPKRIIASALIAVAIVALPLVSFFWSGVSGIRTPADIAGDEGLALALSKDTLRLNLARAIRFMNDAWTMRANTTISLILLGAGIVWWIRVQKWQALPVLLVPLLQAILITLVLPKSRYFLPLLPFMSLALVFILQAVQGKKYAIYRSSAAVLVVVGASALFLIEGHTNLALRVEKYNADAHESAVLIDAARYLRNDHGRVGLRDSQLSSPVSIYIPADRLFVLSINPDDDIVRQELSWMRKEKIKYLLSDSDPAPWDSMDIYPDAFERVHVFESIYGEKRVFIYKIWQEKLP
ncbi:MAG: glycosyltransferase family 39 protein [Candidatus Andersenbacteria bacterium]|nr:glycosyltransferase family 39 protein [Candidatus Andersenbacteria bacterium]